MCGWQSGLHVWWREGRNGRGKGKHLIFFFFQDLTSNFFALPHQSCMLPQSCWTSSPETDVIRYSFSEKKSIFPRYRFIGCPESRKYQKGSYQEKSRHNVSVVDIWAKSWFANLKQSINNFQVRGSQQNNLDKPWNEQQFPRQAWREWAIIWGHLCSCNQGEVPFLLLPL